MGKIEETGSCIFWGRPTPKRCGFLQEALRRAFQYGFPKPLIQQLLFVHSYLQNCLPQYLETNAYQLVSWDFETMPVFVSASIAISELKNGSRQTYRQTNKWTGRRADEVVATVFVIAAKLKDYLYSDNR